MKLEIKNFQLSVGFQFLFDSVQFYSVLFVICYDFSGSPFCLHFIRTLTLANTVVSARIPLLSMSSVRKTPRHLVFVRAD